MKDSIAKEKSGVKNVWEFVPLRGGVGRLMANAILNFHFDFLHPSLTHALTIHALIILFASILARLLQTINKLL